MSDASSEPLARESDREVSSIMLPFGDDGEALEFECIKNRQSVHTAQRILSGETYPLIPALSDVDVVMDVGANCGSASMFFSVHYPHARILAFEPARVPYCVLERNARRRANIEPFNVGLFDRDDDVPLYSGEAGTGSSSILRRPGTTDRSERVQLRSARTLLGEQGITQVDVLKVDTEGCEVPILEAMREWLPGLKVVYLEFHNEDDRKAIDRLLGDTHSLAVARVLFGQGEMAYVSNAVIDAARAS